METTLDMRMSAAEPPSVPPAVTWPGTPRPVSVEDFRLPRSYLGLLIGEAAATPLLARTDQIDGTGPADPYLGSVRFLHHCLNHIQNSDDESYGVAPRPVPLGTFGLAIAAAGQADDFEGALSRFASANRQLRPDVQVQASRSRDALNLTIAYEGERSARKELMVETFAMTAHCAFRWLTAKPLRLVQIVAAEPLPGFERTTLYKVMGCPVIHQGRGVTLRYAVEEAASGIASVKYQNWGAHELGEFMKLLEEAAENLSLGAQPGIADIVQRVRGAITSGARSEVAASQKLGMSPATLRRRLAQVGHSFRAISADIQRSAAESLFVTDKSLDDIAIEIGYSDVRSLRRACQRWFGVTPTVYRRGRRGRRQTARAD